MKTDSKSLRMYALVLGGFVLVIGVVMSVMYIQQSKMTPVGRGTATTTPSVPKTDFGAKLPDSFPTNIPVEKGIQFTQSYSLAYIKEQQMSIVFSSAKTIKANYALYSDFLKTDGWTVSNKYESATVSSLYANKGSSSINVTISNPITPNTAALSQVSISVLINTK